MSSRTLRSASGRSGATRSISSRASASYGWLVVISEGAGVREPLCRQATRTTSRKYIVRGWRLHGDIALAQRRWDDANALCARRLRIARGVRNPTQLWKTHAAFGRLRDAQGKPDEARAAYAAAVKVVDGMRARLTTPALQAALDRAAFVKRLAELSASS